MNNVKIFASIVDDATRRQIAETEKGRRTMTLKEYKEQLIMLYQKMEEQHDVSDIHMYRNGTVVCRIEIS